MNDNATIVAIATPPGHGGVGIVRLSGPEAAAIGKAISGKNILPPRTALRATFKEEGASIDDGLLLFFPSPHSFTGEDVVELQAHGSPIGLQNLVATCIHLGARQAQAGEFSERAFHNGKLDLTRAEAIADLIAAETQAQYRAAQHTMEGVVHSLVHQLRARILASMTEVEATIDFSDEDIAPQDNARLAQELTETLKQSMELLAQSQQGSLLRNGAKVVITGRPNVGKSTLLNALAGYEAALVTPIPGTTRDTIKERIHIDGLPLHIIDTAGIRETLDQVEQAGIERARRNIASADLVLMVVDGSHPLSEEESQHINLLPTERTLLVANKADLLPDGDAPTLTPHVLLSAETGRGLPELRAEIKARLGFQGATACPFTARVRQITHLKSAIAALEQAQSLFQDEMAIELVAEELRMAAQALGAITGEITTEEVLGEIFSKFCVGK